MAESNGIVVIVVTVFTLILFRLLYVLHRCAKSIPPTTVKPLTILIVLGSGSMAKLQTSGFCLSCSLCASVAWLMGAWGQIGLNLLLQMLSIKKTETLGCTLISGSALSMYFLHHTSVLQACCLLALSKYMQIYRSREVGQSYITSVGTTLIAIAHALWLMTEIRPQVVLGIRWSLIFYVESIARVKRLSLSGLLLYKLRMVDQLYVQWPQLQRKYPRSIYVGCLM